MKLFHKIAITSLGLAMATAVGAGIARCNRNDVKMANAAKGDTVNDSAVTLSQGQLLNDGTNDYIQWSHADGKIIIKQERNCAASGTSSQQTFNAVANNIATPRVYYGNMLSFAATDDFMIIDIKIVYSSSSYGGAGLLVGDALDNDASLVCGTKSKPVPGGIAVIENTTDFTLTTDAKNLTHTVTVDKVGGADTIYIQNYDGGTVTTQLRPTSITISYIVGNEATNPDTIEISGETTFTAGQSEQLTSVAKHGGSSTGVLQTVEWSSSDEAVAIVSETGLVTALTSGNANIYATSTGDNTIIGTHAITVSDSADGSEPVTISPNLLQISGTTYASNNGFHTRRGLVVETNQVAESGSDYVKEEVIQAYQKGAFMFQKNAGYIKTRTTLAHNIKRVVISACSNSAPLVTVAGGATAGSTSVEPAAPINVGRMYTYEFASAVQFVTISATGSTGYFNSVTFEFVDNVETVNSLADFILGIAPHRTDVTGLCEGTNGNYETAKARFVAVTNPAVKSAFQTSEDEIVTSARERYVQWAGVYGDSTPFADTYGAQDNTIKISYNTNYTAIILVTSAIAVISLAGFVFFSRKRKAQ